MIEAAATNSRVERTIRKGQVLAARLDKGWRALGRKSLAEFASLTTIPQARGIDHHVLAFR